MIEHVKTYTIHIPPEPPAGTHVRSSEGNTFVKRVSPGTAVRVNAWFPIEGGQGRTWTELLKEFGGLIDVTPVRTFELPPEPAIGTKVRDSEGDLWTRGEEGWLFRRDVGGHGEVWAHVMRYAPLSEVR